MTGGEVVWIEKDWAQRFVDRASSIARNKVLIAAEGLKPAMQPLRPAHICVTVGDEGAILERYSVTHNPAYKGNETSLCPDVSSIQLAVGDLLLSLGDRYGCFVPRSRLSQEAGPQSARIHGKGRY